MTATPAVPLHPRLHSLAATHRRRLRLLGLLFFMVMAGTLVYVMAVAFTSQDGAKLLLLGLIGLLMLPVVALVGGLLWYLDHGLSRSLNGADRLLRDCESLAVRLVPVGPETRAGVLVELHPLAGAAASAGPIHGLINPSFRWSAPPRREIEVRLYCRECAPGNEWVALQPDGVPLLGKMVDRKVYERRQRALRIAILIVLGSALVVILVFGGVGR